MTFWDFFWLMLWGFLFVAYLMVLFQVIVDMFRDDSLNGWAKAAWLIFLFIFPPLTALIYLIARGRGMGERQMASAIASRQAADEYIRQTAAGGTDPTEQIAKAKALLDDGTISAEEFAQLKAKALG